eukprot:827861-Pleurochrysis_carterae.AAC.1
MCTSAVLPAPIAPASQRALRAEHEIVDISLPRPAIAEENLRRIRIHRRIRKAQAAAAAAAAAVAAAQVQAPRHTHTQAQAHAHAGARARTRRRTRTLLHDLALPAAAPHLSHVLVVRRPPRRERPRIWVLLAAVGVVRDL